MKGEGIFPITHSPFLITHSSTFMFKLRWQHIAILALVSWLVACTTAHPQFPGARKNLPETATSSDASRALRNSIGGECNASPDSYRTQYIIGYGSLMQDESRKRTSPQAGPAYPVDIKGYRRGWFARGAAVGFGATYLGIWPDQASHLNAVIYQVDQTELAATDKREMSYCRTGVETSDIRTLANEFIPDTGAQIWIYVSLPQHAATPDSRYPIVQSYVDIFISGCLEQEQRFGLAEFSQECLSTTTDWSEHWVNDRIYPRRPFIYQPRAGQIDHLLSRQLHQYFSRIRIESSG